MRVRVIAFATAADVIGHEPLPFELATGAGTEALGAALCARFPDLARMWPRLAVAVDGAIVRGDSPLREGVEVALLPPVSGGAPGAAAPSLERLRAALARGPIDVAAVSAEVESKECGAVVLFLGTVRDHHAGKKVVRLTYSAYESLARTRLEAIVRDLEDAHEGLRAAIVHRLGTVPIGEPSVVIAVAAPHRQAAYDASRTALERLKREVPIWKRETYSGGGEVWREEEPLVPAARA